MKSNGFLCIGFKDFKEYSRIIQYAITLGLEGSPTNQLEPTIDTVIYDTVAFCVEEGKVYSIYGHARRDNPFFTHKVIHTLPSIRRN